ncbi:hypothetical protein BGW36DRAFT_420777 [Talaromyces proteolyticus]|uniref:Uncharacterized protein n=1 Tax=Talaromyces proteolyticus TaxID=1131652 RepID=A0AAD4PTY8_9EURO|nr:uncharacterized protein BGW36DRAFT_420777 [Talaromyces proteolyticus]KAH8689476.1 hypothetical protein BGW36DRAFT_420777 [Talaromyces proteolyticus]
MAHIFHPNVAVPSVDSEDLRFPNWPPPNPREILSRREFYRDRMKYRKYRAPMRVFEDSPLYALYRLYEWIMVDHTVNMRNELELFWWNRWPVSSIPDPGENGDAERYAVLACIPALIVTSFNERINQGLRREEPHSILSAEEQRYWAATPKNYEMEPSWTESVAPLESTLHIPHSQPWSPQLTTLDDPEASPEFKKKNILAIKPHIHFI